MVDAGKAVTRVTPLMVSSKRIEYASILGRIVKALTF